MKLASLILALALVLSSTVFAQERSLSGNFEIQSVTPAVEKNLILSGGLIYKVTPQFAGKLFFLTKGPWAEVYAGPMFTPAAWIQLYACAGASQKAGELELRTAYGINLIYRAFVFSAGTEMNNAAYKGDYKSIWYDITATYQPLSWLIVGLKDRRPVGFGPMIRFRYDVAEVWVTWAPVSSENSTTDMDRFIVGLKFNL
ncbi:MAG: hypothetical protein UT32_C0002G0060 [Parcubacteria group bacterium GW2011_GWC2_39_14]|nr:MAG: hypothetical protein UT32_C0002G0060 [Parcubacteria group bacterium GW2011_GWC2_39_14]KKR55285.1 MAG: hypothetical protein UT91_C0003G0060 [Parcubacteria group bacterium GW2011_GWA2_40_23]